MSRRRTDRRTAPSTLADLLRDSLSGKPIGRRLREGIIWEVWERAVGKTVAGRAQPVRVADGVLTVAVATAAWMQQLTFLKPEICSKINALAGENLVRDLHIRHGRIAKPRQEPPPAPPPRMLSREERDTVLAESQAIEDDEIRSAFERLMAAHLASYGN